MQRRAFSRMSVWFGESLVIDGLVRGLAAGLDHACRHFRVVAESHAAFLHVRTGDVDLDGVDGRIVEQPRDLDVFLDGRARHVGEEARLAEIERGQDLPDHVFGARILQADGVQHARGRFVDAVRLVAEPRLAGGALEHDGADVAVGEPVDAGVFLAETHASGQQHDGRGERQPAEIHLQGPAGFAEDAALSRRRSWGAHCTMRAPCRPPRYRHCSAPWWRRAHWPPRRMPRRPRIPPLRAPRSPVSDPIPSSAGYDDAYSLDEIKLGGSRAHRGATGRALAGGARRGPRPRRSLAGRLPLVSRAHRQRLRLPRAMRSSRPMNSATIRRPGCWRKLGAQRHLRRCRRSRRAANAGSRKPRRSTIPPRRSPW